MSRITVLAAVFIFCFGLFSSPGPAAPDRELIIYQIPIHGTIDLGLTAFLRRSLTQAREQQASAVVFTINTFGGRVDAADEIVTAIRDIEPIPAYTYITDSAWSAGALISLASPVIIMRKGSSIGSAEPRTMGFGQNEETTDEKILSSLRAKFKATAEANGHSSLLAEAMVDKDIEIVQATINGDTILLLREQLEQRRAEPDTMVETETLISAKGKLLNLTAEEALSLNLAAAVVATDAEFHALLAEKLNVPSPAALRFIVPAPSWSENIVRFLTHPIVSSLLLSLGFMGLLFELRIPGWGISGTLGALFLIIFFWGHYLAGLANWFDIALVTLGILLIIVELASPGFGVFGISGLSLTLIGLTLTMVRHPFAVPNLQLDQALRVMTYSGIVIIALTVAAFRFLPATRAWKRLTLETSEQKEDGFQASSTPVTIQAGAVGIAKTILRPSGRAVFNDSTFEVISDGAFIPAGARVTVVRLDGARIIVEQTREA